MSREKREDNVEKDIIFQGFKQGWGAGAGCFWLLGVGAGAAKK